MEIRPFQTTDQPAAKALILAGLAAHWGWLDPTRNPDLDDIAVSYAGGVFLVAYDRGELVGTGALIPAGKRVGRLVRMSVAESRRRQGIGRDLLQALIAAAQERGYTHLVLETTATWAEAIAFYEVNGFRRSHEANGDVHLCGRLMLRDGGDWPAVPHLSVGCFDFVIGGAFCLAG